MANDLTIIPVRLELEQVVLLGAALALSLLIVAAAATLGYFVVVLGLAPLVRHITPGRAGRHQLHLVYTNGAGVLRHSLVEAQRLGFALSDLTIRKGEGSFGEVVDTVQVDVLVEGHRPLADLVGVIGQLPGMVRVRTADEDWEAA